MSHSLPSRHRLHNLQLLRSTQPPFHLPVNRIPGPPGPRILVNDLELVLLVPPHDVHNGGGPHVEVELLLR